MHRARGPPPSPAWHDAEVDAGLWASMRLAASPPKAPATPNHKLHVLLDPEELRLPSRAASTSSRPLRPTASLPSIPNAPRDAIDGDDDDDDGDDGRGGGGGGGKSHAASRRRPPLARAQSLQDAPHPIQLAASASAASSSNSDANLEQPLDARLFCPRGAWIPHAQRRACVVCERDFGLLRKRHTCRMCGDVVCRTCSVFRSVLLPVGGDGRARVCSLCVLRERQRRQRDLPGSASGTTLPSPGATSSSSSSASPSPSPASSATPTPPASVPPVGGNRGRGVALLSPELLVAVAPRETSIAGRPAPPRPRPPAENLMLLSPTASAELSGDQLTLEDFSPSFTSTISTVSSSASSSAGATATRWLEEELVAALRARELEKEVEASRRRIHELEQRIREQPSPAPAATRSRETAELDEARALIATLQSQLREQKRQARDAVERRESLCGRQSLPRAARSGSSTTTTNSADEDSAVLRQKLRLLERQLQQAGLNIAELIPYEVAKQRVQDLSQRMAEVSDALGDAGLPAAAATALRREAFTLEQELERYHTALLLSDEHQAEQQRAAQAWAAEHAEANARALATVRAATPVEVAHLSERQLRALATPSGRPMPAELARRLKRTNALELVRVSPERLRRMHPSVLEGFRTTGLGVLERRALHAALEGVATEWTRHATATRDDLAQRRSQWFAKLHEALTRALAAMDAHARDHPPHPAVPEGEAPPRPCPLLGRQCPVRQEAAIAALYEPGLGFPPGPEFPSHEVVKGDAEGSVGERAREEARAHAGARVTLSQRSAALRAHYGPRPHVVAQAAGAMDELDGLVERIRSADAGVDVGTPDASRWRVVEALERDVREVAQLTARRAGICLTGKRDPTRDGTDPRAPLEAEHAEGALGLVVGVLGDLERACERLAAAQGSGAIVRGALARTRALVVDVRARNAALLRLSGGAPEMTGGGDERRPWDERSPSVATVVTTEVHGHHPAPGPSVGASGPRPPPSQGAQLLDAIRAKRATAVAPEGGGDGGAGTGTRSGGPTATAAVDLLAAIRARRQTATA